MQLCSEHGKCIFCIFKLSSGKCISIVDNVVQCNLIQYIGMQCSLYCTFKLSIWAVHSVHCTGIWVYYNKIHCNVFFLAVQSCLSWCNAEDINSISFNAVFCCFYTSLCEMLLGEFMISELKCPWFGQPLKFNIEHTAM